MIGVEEINRIEELDRIRAVWQTLWSQTQEASFFQTLRWLEVYWDHFGAGQKLRVLVVTDAGGPVGIVPLVVRRESTRLGSVRVLTYPLHDWGSFYSPIGPRPAAALSAALAHVRRTRRDWDLVELRWIPSDGPELPETERALREAGFQARRTVWDRTAVVDLQGGWDAYLASRNGKWRNNLRSDQRKLGRQATVEFIRYRPLGAAHAESDPRWDLYDDCERIAQRSWQGDSTTGTTLSHEAVRRFLRDSHAAAAEAGALDLNLLRLDGRPAAFAYNYSCKGNVFGVRAGFDAEVSRHGAGNVLLTAAIEDSFRRGDRLYDLGTGYVACKRHLLTRIVPIYRLSHFHPTAPKAQLLRVKRWLQARREDREPVLCGTG